MTLDTNGWVALAAFAIGLGFGALARWSGFCMRGAVEDALTRPEAPRLRGFLLAMAVAVIATQTLVLLAVSISPNPSYSQRACYGWARSRAGRCSVSA